MLSMFLLKDRGTLLLLLCSIFQFEVINNVLKHKNKHDPEQHTPPPL